MSKFYNRARMTATTAVTGTLKLGLAVPGYNSFFEAGVQHGDTVTYLAEDGNNYEVGRGVYDVSAQTLTRDTVLRAKVHGSSAGTDHINLSSATIVSIIVAAEDLDTLGSGTTTDLTFSDLLATPFYVFHGFAENQQLGDPRFYDISGMGAHGEFGTDLSNANAWANASYVSTVNPAGGVTDSVIRFPGLNFDYAGGEKLILWWLGKVTAEGANASFIGDGLNGVNAGVRVRVRSDQKFDVAVSDGTTQEFSIPTSSVVGDGNVHSFAWVLDGSTKKYTFWVDEVQETLHFDQFATMGSGASRDTRNAVTFNIGSPTPKSAASTDGIASQTRAFVLLRLSPTDTLPSIGALTDLLLALRAAPDQLISTRALSA